MSSPEAGSSRQLFAFSSAAWMIGISPSSIMSYGVVVVIPVLAVFLLLQRRIMQGLAMTGIK